MFVHIVGQQHHVRMFDEHLPQRFQLGGIIGSTGRVRRRVENEPARLWRNRRVQLLGCDFIILRRRRHNDDGRTASKLDDVGIAYPIRCRDDDLVAFVDGRNQRVEQSVLAARVHRDLFVAIFDIIIAFEFCRNRGLERGNAVNGGIFGLTTADSLNRGVLNKIRSIEIRFACREANDINALCF